MSLGVGFQLLARFERTLASPDDFLRELEAWICEYCVDLSPSTRIGFSEDQPTLFCQVHPAAGELYLSLVDLDHLVASAKTSTVGPGYHIFVCDLVRKLGEKFHLCWLVDNEDYFDEGEYFFSGDRENVFKEMTAWLRGLCRSFFDGTFEEEPGDMPTLLCLPIGISGCANRHSAWAARSGMAQKGFGKWRRGPRFLCLVEARSRRRILLRPGIMSHVD